MKHKQLCPRLELGSSSQFPESITVTSHNSIYVYVCSSVCKYVCFYVHVCTYIYVSVYGMCVYRDTAVSWLTDVCAGVFFFLRMHTRDDFLAACLVEFHGVFNLIAPLFSVNFLAAALTTQEPSTPKSCLW